MDKLCVGYELDSLVATYVMKWTISSRGTHWIMGDDSIIRLSEFSPSSEYDIKSTLWVLNKMRSDGIRIAINMPPYSEKISVIASVKDELCGFAEETSFPIAVCKMALDVENWKLRFGL